LIPVDTHFLLYGSYGYTGTLIADLAVGLGMHPILSGRDASRLKVQADKLSMDYHPLSLDDRPGLEAILGKVPLVLNCAGPFSRTFQPMSETCLKLGRHYLDITGEIMVFEALARRDAEAKQAGVMLLPGIGFDVVPSDCLAMHLRQRLPKATHLALIFYTTGGGISRGTALTVIEGLQGQCIIRKDGKLTPVPLFSKTTQIDFGSGLRTAINNTWGDVSTAYYSTGIPNIEEFMVFKKSFIRIVRLIRPLIGFAKSPAMQRWLTQRVMQFPPGPSVEKRWVGRSRLWGEAKDELGNRVITRMETPEGYSLTAETALAAVRRALAGDYKAGFQTPAMAYGADFILEFDGVQREDIN
jgi:short subunit dehydrogenase-like uncharacterized protein